jgi:aminoglycoside phosphotransferase
MCVGLSCIIQPFNLCHAIQIAPKPPAKTTLPQHPEPNAVARRLIVLLYRARENKYLRRVWKPAPGLTAIFNVCIKVNWTPSAGLAEASAMRFVAEHTSVPVPRVYCAFVHKGNSYIIMSKLKGGMARNLWPLRTAESKAKILGQLRRMVAELRSVPPPEGTRVGNIDGGPFYDGRLPSKLLWGPYDTVREFHEDLVGGADLDADFVNLPGDAAQLFGFYKQAGDQLVLTHGDLSSLNIMVEGDEVVGIVDWETAGWFPPYWEYTCAKNVNPYNPFWADEVDSFIEPMPQELAMDRIRQGYFGAF